MSVRLAAAVAIALGLPGLGIAQVSDQEAKSLFLDTGYEQAVTRKVTLGAQCQAALAAKAGPEACALYRDAALAVLARDDARFAWCSARIKRVQAQQGEHAKIQLPEACSRPSGLDEQDDRIADLLAQADPARASLAQQAAREVQAQN